MDGKCDETGEEGYLLNLSQWSKAVAEQMATEDGIELMPNHWEVINFNPFRAEAINRDKRPSACSVN